MGANMTMPVDDRLDRLEREVRRWRWLGAPLSIGMVALIASGAASAPPGEVKARRIVIEDKEGRQGIILDVQDGIPYLSLLADGQAKISATINGDGSPILSFVDAGKDRLVMGLSRGGAPIVNLNDADQKRRISVGIFNHVGPIISVLDPTNKVLFKAP